jgi:hypothetical protein
VVLDGGRIVEQGSHENLLALGGIYASLWSHQSGGFLPATDAERLGQPQGPAVYHADPSEHAGGSLHDWFGRTFGRGHWKRDR